MPWATEALIMLVSAPVSKVSLSDWCQSKAMKWGDCSVLTRCKTILVEGWVGDTRSSALGGLKKSESLVLSSLSRLLIRCALASNERKSTRGKTGPGA